MKQNPPVQFRTSDIKTSGMSFSHTVSEGVRMNVSITDFEAMMVYAENDICRSMLKIVMYADSVQGETHQITQKLLGPSCLNVQHYRVISFESTDLVMVAENEYLLYGNLSVCGIRKLIVFEVKDRSPGSAKENSKLCKMEFDGIIHLSDFKIKSTSATDDELALKGVLVFKNDVTSFLHDFRSTPPAL